MRTPRFSASVLVSLLRDQTVATLSELIAALGTQSRRTDAMPVDPTKKKANWVYSDDFELDVAAYMLPSLWWSAAMYGRSLSRAYTTLERRDGATVSPVAMTF